MKKLLIVLSLILLSACSQQQDNHIDTIWKNKTEFVGDNSKVISILNGAGAEDIGAYKIEIESDKEPYNLKIHFDNVTNVDTEQLDKLVAVTMGLIGNLERMQIIADNEEYNYTLENVNKKYKMNVKELSKDKEKLEMFLEK